MRLLMIFTIMLLSFTNARAQSLKQEVSELRKGIASFYHNKFEGRKTATGECSAILSTQRLVTR